MSILNYTPETISSEKPIVTEQNTLRIIIGLLGFFLPLILWIGLFIYTGLERTRPLSSISHYYYSRVSSIFAITLGTLSIVLFAYEGNRRSDYWLTTTAAVSALFVIIFPTNMELVDNQMPPHYVTRIEDNPFRGDFHFLSAGIFLLSLAAMSLFRFPRNDSSNETPSLIDRVAYRACGIIMILSLLIIFLGAFGIIFPKSWFLDKDSTGIFWGETVAVCTFGYSWLLKAGFFSRIVRKFF